MELVIVLGQTPRSVSLFTTRNLLASSSGVIEIDFGAGCGKPAFFCELVLNLFPMTGFFLVYQFKCKKKKKAILKHEKYKERVDDFSRHEHDDNKASKAPPQCQPWH